MATLDEILGRGFVKSGSGYVSTPATRAAAIAAGTYGATGYAGAEQTAAQLSRALNLSGGLNVDAARAAQAESDALRRRVVAAKAAGLTLPEYDAKIATAKTIMMASGIAGAITTARPTILTPTAPAPTTPTTPAVKCPRGLRYTKLTRWSQCDAGYVSTKGSGLNVLGVDLYPLLPGNECVCEVTEAGQAIIKAESEPKPSDIPDGENGEGFFGDIFGEGEGAGKIKGMVLLVVGGAIVVALLGLFKK